LQHLMEGTQEAVKVALVVIVSKHLLDWVFKTSPSVGMLIEGCFILTECYSKKSNTVLGKQRYYNRMRLSSETLIFLLKSWRKYSYTSTMVYPLLIEVYTCTYYCV
jgi:hypothetical protein